MLEQNGRVVRALNHDADQRTAAEERFETIYTALRERISLLDYAPGTRLSEVELGYLCEVYQLRMELVTYMYLVPRKPATDDLLERMQETRQRCLEIPESANAKRLFARLNIEFFEQRMELVGSRPLREMLGLLFSGTPYHRDGFGFAGKEQAGSGNSGQGGPLGLTMRRWLQRKRALIRSSTHDETR